MDFVSNYLRQLKLSLNAIDPAAIDLMAKEIAKVRDGLMMDLAGNQSLFIVGNGGGAAHAMHAAADFRNLCGVRCITPWDNVAEMTAIENDHGWSGAYALWMNRNGFSHMSVLLVISVGGGVGSVSTNIVKAVEYARIMNGTILGICGLGGGFTASEAKCCVIVRCDPLLTTPIVESVQCAILHALAVHPSLATKQPKWERTK